MSVAARAFPDEHLRQLVNLVRDFSGLELPDNRRQSLERVVDRTMRDLGLRDAGALHRHLAKPTSRLALEAFTAALTIGETHFYRNIPQSDAIRVRVLPELIARRTHERRLRIWSAGCSTGEEAYSLAMMLDTLMPRREGWNILILATDINKDALERAQRGVYGQWSFRQVPNDVKQRYFVQREGKYHLDGDIRSMVTFRYLNLVEDSYPALMSNTQAMDLILCRNVLIYFREATINRVVGRLDACLAPGGWLVAGHAESPMAVFRERFIAREFPMTILFQKSHDGSATVTDKPAVTDASGASPRAVQGTVPASTGAPAVTVSRAATRPSPVVTTASSRADVAGVTDLEAGLASATSHWRAGQSGQALELLHDLADQRPDDARPLCLAARILAGALRLGPAEHTAQLALARDPLSAQSHYVHGLILQELGRPAEALEAVRRCVYLDPTLALGHYSLASLLVTAGQVPRADKALLAAIDLVGGRPRDEAVEDGDGVTYGRLRELAEIQRQLIATEACA